MSSESEVAQGQEIVPGLIEEIVEWLHPRDQSVIPETLGAIAKRFAPTIADGETIEAAWARYSAQAQQEIELFLDGRGVPEEALNDRGVPEKVRETAIDRIANDVLKGDAVAAAFCTRWRQQVQICQDESVMLRDTIRQMYRYGGVFQRGPVLVEPRLMQAPPEGSIIRKGASWSVQRINSSRARALAAEACDFGKPDREGNLVPANVPKYLPDAILHASEWPFPVLTWLAEAPTLRPDGSLLARPGYDAATGIYLASDLTATVPDVPTQFDAKRAASALLDVVAEFDFASTAGRSAWLAGVLSVAARPAIAGPLPMVIVDASVRGAGKSKLVDVASLITTGREAARMAYTSDDVELDKRIMSVALGGDSLILLDNVVGQLGSPSLDAALTGTSYKGRLLGRSETPTLPMLVQWWASGNGMTIGGDLARRSVLVRLEPKCARPEERTGPAEGTSWRYPRLLDHVREHRAELLSAVLTIVRGFIVAGRPAQRLTPMGSFEAWSDLIRSAIVWCGQPDPCDTIVEVRAADERANAFANAVAHWPVADDVEVTAAELVELAEPVGIATYIHDAEKARAKLEAAERAKREKWREALVAWLPPRRGDKLPTPPALGRALRGVRGAIVGAYRIDGGKHGERGTPWRKARVDRAAQHEAA